MAGAPRALARETPEIDETIARGVTAMVVGSSALFGSFCISQQRSLRQLIVIALLFVLLWKNVDAAFQGEDENQTGNERNAGNHRNEIGGRLHKAAVIGGERHVGDEESCECEPNETIHADNLQHGRLLLFRGG
jgi:hypothetical protein